MHDPAKDLIDRLADQAEENRNIERKRERENLTKHGMKPETEDDVKKD